MDHEARAAALRAEITALAKPDGPSIRVVRRRHSLELRAADTADVFALARAVDLASPQPTKWVAYELVRFHPGAFGTVAEGEIQDFASRVASWYATDALGTILSGPLWARERLPDALVDGWSRSENRWLRRLALVSTVGRNAHRPDPDRTFAICLALAADRDDMVVKAESWALRYLSQKDRAAVVDFMAEHGDRFAARVRREVTNKLETGRKNRRPARDRAPVSSIEHPRAH